MNKESMLQNLENILAENDSAMGDYKKAVVDVKNALFCMERMKERIEWLINAISRGER